ncbi:MAG: helix-turn-helix domain-containing protein [Clostridiales bacterium]|nr:helix-turn-helix domain-containing protein [Clostridiales bacterium]
MDIGTSRAAEILNCSQETVRRWCREGIFKTATQDGKGKPWHISEKEVYQVLEKISKKG